MYDIRAQFYYGAKLSAFEVIREIILLKVALTNLLVRSTPSPSTIIAILIVIISLISLFFSSPSTRPLNCDMECGETILSLRAAQQFREHGIQFGLLENLGTTEEPLIYTHNVNIGTLSFIGMESLGIPDYYKFLMPLAIYGLGLAYVFLTVRRISGNAHLALVTLVLFAVTYWGLGAYALNALRAWHLFAFFSVIFYSYGLVKVSLNIREVIGLILGASAAFVCGYDFWIICAAVSLMVSLANRGTCTLKQIRSIVLILGAIFALPFILRQIHVAWAMGLFFWAQDFIYSIAIKVPYASKLIDIPSLDVIDAYYKEHNVLRAPAQPSNSIGQILFTLGNMVNFVTIPRWGIFSLVLLAFIAIMAVIPKIRSSSLGIYSAALVLPTTIGIAIGLIIFAPFSLHVYVKHEFPLIGFLLLLVKGAAFYFLISILIINKKVRVWKTRLAIFLLTTLVIDTTMLHWNNTKYGPALNLKWGEFFAEHPEEKIALSTYRLGFITYTEPFIKLDSNRAVYVTPDSMLSEKSNLKYWIYQPHHSFVDFDSPVPACNWTGWIRQLIGWRPSISPDLSCIYKQPLPKGAVRERSIKEIIDAAEDNYSIVEVDLAGNGYVIFKRK